MILLRLFLEFFKAGLFAVGGGMATLPFMYDISTRTGWFTHEMLADMVAVSESTPGPIGVNMATYVGFVTAGVPGALIATLESPTGVLFSVIVTHEILTGRVLLGFALILAGVLISEVGGKLLERLKGEGVSEDPGERRREEPASSD